MNIRQLFTAAALCALSCAAAGRILFTVGPTPVTGEEYARYLRHSVGGTLDAYIDFKLKVADALSAGIDTTAAFRLHLAALEGEVMRAYQAGKDAAQDAAAAHSLLPHPDISRRTIKLSTATISLKQSATLRQERLALERMDTLRALYVAGGGAFTEASGVEVRAGEDCPVAGLLKEFVAQIERLSPGEVSLPFISPLGVHIIKVGGLPVEHDGPRPMRHFDEAGLTDPALQERLAEARDGLLAAFWDGMNGATEPAASDMKAYFERNRSAYRWDLPHYKGAVIVCPDKKTAAQIKKALKKLPVEEWESAARGHASWRAEVTAGLFRIGDNAVIDREAFGCGGKSAAEAGRYTFIMGRRLDKGPDDYRDVEAQVRRDCMSAQRAQLMQELRKRYKVQLF